MRGGARVGAGRKKGVPTAATRRRQEVALRALEAGITPLEIMLEAMRVAYEQGGAVAAIQYAKEAAPYIHPRLSSVEANVQGSYLPAPAPQAIPVEEREPFNA